MYILVTNARTAPWIFELSASFSPPLFCAGGVNLAGNGDL